MDEGVRDVGVAVGPAFSQGQRTPRDAAHMCGAFAVVSRRRGAAWPGLAWRGLRVRRAGPASGADAFWLHARACDVGVAS